MSLSPAWTKPLDYWDDLLQHYKELLWVSALNQSLHISDNNGESAGEYTVRENSALVGLGAQSGILFNTPNINRSLSIDFNGRLNRPEAAK